MYMFHYCDICIPRAPWEADLLLNGYPGEIFEK